MCDGLVVPPELNVTYIVTDAESMSVLFHYQVLYFITLVSHYDITYYATMLKNYCAL